MPSDDLSFEKTYALAPDPPPPMQWDDYERRVLDAWRELLARRPEEVEVQTFLEAHPSMIPGAFSALGRMKSGHGPFMNAVVSQPPLMAKGAHVPDFLWMSRDSSFFNPVFIEIEKPGKPWMNKNGVQSGPLTQALDQLRRWREWLHDPVNQQVFLDRFQVPQLFRRRSFEPLFVLIYGLRDSDPEAISKLRVGLKRPDQFVIPYEHLAPDRDCSDFICIKHRRDGYRAVAFPPTVRLGPATAEDWSHVSGREAAIEKSALISEERKAFLTGRLAYWDDHARNGRRTWGSRDFE